MTGNELKAILDRFRIRQVDLARLLDVTPRTVSVWATGDGPVPGVVEAYLRVLQLLSPEALAIEISMLERSERMLDDGLYLIRFGGTDDLGQGVLAFAGGRISGVDIGGAQYEGVYGLDVKSGLNRAEVTLIVPPSGALVTGAVAGPMGARLTLRAEFSKPSPISYFTVDVGGRPVSVELSYVRRLPN